MPPKQSRNQSRNSKSRGKSRGKSGQMNRRTRKKQEREARLKEEKDRIELAEKLELEEKQKKEKAEKDARDLAERQRMEREKQRLFDEEVQLSTWRKQYAKCYTEHIKKKLEKEDWLQFFKCDPMPKANCEKQITAFLTDYSHPFKIDYLTIKDSLEKCEYTEKILENIHTELLKSIAKVNREEQIIHKRHIKLYRIRTQQHINEITSYFAVNCDQLILEQGKKKLSQEEQKQTEDVNLQGEQKEKAEIMKQYKFDHIKFGVRINLETKGFMKLQIEFKELGMIIEQPIKFASQKNIMRVIFTSFDSYQGDEYSKFMVIGGVLDVKYFQFLPLPKVYRGWTMKYEYTVDNSLIELKFNALNFHGQQGVDFMYQYTLKPTIYVGTNDKIQIGIFEDNQWKLSENITEVDFDHATKVLKFKTYTLLPHAFISDRCLDYPYNGWKLRCVKKEKAILEIDTKRLQLRIEIYAGYVVLKNRTEYEFSHIVNKQLTPGQLLKALLNCGVNLLPQVKDAESAQIIKKSVEAEENAIQDLVIWVKAFFIKSSKWSSTLSSDKILVRLRENTEYDEVFAEDQEKDWKSVCFWREKCGIIKSKDSEDQCNEAFIKETDTHATLALLLTLYKLTTQKVLDTWKDQSQMIFQNTVRKMFRLTKLLTFNVK